MTTWETDLQDVRQRLADLDPERALASARAAAATARWSRGEFFLPLPLIARERRSVHGSWVDEPEREDWTAERVELDAAGRPVVHVLGAGSFMERINELWWWDGDGSLLEIELMGFGPHVRRWRDGHVVTASDGDRFKVQLLSETRSDAAEIDDEGVLWAVATVLDGDRVLRAREVVEGELGAALARAATLVPDVVVWDGRLERPEPWPDDPGALVEPLARALDRALREAVAESGVAEPFVLEVNQSRDDPLFPPSARVAGTQWRERMRRASSKDGAAVAELYNAASSGDGAVLALVDRLDDEALRYCRALSTALQAGSPLTPDRHHFELAEAVGTRLAELLHATPFERAAEPFLALVGVGDPYGQRTADDRSRAAAGEERYARFMASVRSLKAPAGVSPERALTDRGVLEELLREGGLPELAPRLAVEIARVGFRLEPGEGRRSRLGGPALLPRGAAWPDELTFLAGIDLAELPPSALPERGWLLFFADVDGDPREAFRLFVTDDPVEAEGPALAQLSVVARPYLTLPQGWNAGEVLGLDAYQETMYDELADRLFEAMPEQDEEHWVGGHVRTPQGTLPDDGSLLLFHIESDDDLAFQLGDGGCIQFRIAPNALAARDWARVFVEVDSY